MAYKRIIPFINSENEIESSVLKLAQSYEQSGADGLFIYNYCMDDESHEQYIHFVKEIVKEIDIPVIMGLYVKRLEDVKKACYTGVSHVVIKYDSLKDKGIIEEATARFGKERIVIELDYSKGIVTKELIDELAKANVAALLLKHVTTSTVFHNLVNESPIPVIVRDSLMRNDMTELLSFDNISAVSTNHYENKNIMKVKLALKDNNISVNTYESTLQFEDFKLNSDGMVTVVTQDYKTNEVLMVAYMNKEAFDTTVATGKMTYFSRSRQELWIKGETSGHYQYVKSLTIDCDNDTILAKVKQIGAACHTGHRSCFFTDLVKREYNDTNPLTVFQDVYNVIMDRRNHPKEGSYTNYLFDKGIDKILKKCGEEATEIVIAAKNPDSEELKYEICDFLYHMMVLMAKCGLDWNDVAKELAHRES